ncbi:MAG TPA: radical SAM protein [bacterium]|nr:radical SAM protein [Myxococcales bacterium]OQA62140.1 MAG: Radical SAM superfamily protein [bacterium ADurb.Bin270]HPW45978.1 radical SAM protein [bacterium]HQC50268.1 radical SAM protein [bacterium]
MTLNQGPSYLELSRCGELESRASAAIEAMERCDLCPRGCRVNRASGEIGFCRVGRKAGVASHNLHFGEEPPITGTKGSGTIFFTGCNMRCKFCQNYPISQNGNGEIVSAERLAEMMLSLQGRGAHNINLVSPSHMAAQFLESLCIAAKKGLRIPIVYNSSGYEGMKALKLLDGVIDIYMPDIKYATAEAAKFCSSAPDYWRHARPAIIEMYRQVGALQMDEEGIGVRGMLIRHLVLPNGLASSREIFRFVAEELGTDIPVNLMSQYFPAHAAVDDPILRRKITKEEFEAAKEALLEFNLVEGWMQEME